MRFTSREIATILAALDAWKDELVEGNKWLMECHDFRGNTPLTRDEVDDLRDRLKRKRRVVIHPPDRESWLVHVPTFVGHQHDDKELADASEAFTTPLIPMLLYKEEGLRIMLGTECIDDDSKPDVRVERRPHGWAFFFHPNSGDRAANVYLLDDGRSFVLCEPCDPPTELVEDIPVDIDRM
jgi:hypothetical protein